MADRKKTVYQLTAQTTSTLHTSLKMCCRVVSRQFSEPTVQSAETLYNFEYWLPREQLILQNLFSWNSVLH